MFQRRKSFEMHGKVWMFSDLIDDEDMEFMQHEFISYKQAMDYYNLEYKPIVRLSHRAGAVYKIGKKVLLNRYIGDFGYRRLSDRRKTRELDSYGKMIMEECRNGFDEETRQKLHGLVKAPEQREQGHQKYKERLEHYQKFFKNGTYERRWESGQRRIVIWWMVR